MIILFLSKNNILFVYLKQLYYLSIIQILIFTHRNKIFTYDLILIQQDNYMLNNLLTNVYKSLDKI